MKLVYNDTTHAYWLGGKRVKSASKVAGITADRFTVEQWMKRQIAIGMTLEPRLAERVAVDLDNREAIQEVCDDALTVAKSNARAERGTQRHRVFELVLLGEDTFITDQQRADAIVLRRTLDAYGLEPMPDRVEQFIAWPDHMVVGRYDAVLGYQGAPALVDLKGGINAVKYPHSTLTQLGLYLFAPNTSAKIERDGDKSTVIEWTTMPDGIDLENAYVIYCDDDHEVGELWRMDMRHGKAGAELALSVIDWRKKHKYGDEAVTRIAAPVPSTVEQPATVAVEDAATVANITITMPAGSAEKVLAAMGAPSRKAQLLARFEALTADQKAEFKARRMRKGDLDAVEKALDSITADRTRPGEGHHIDESDFAPMAAAYEKLPDAAKKWCARLLAESREAGVPFHRANAPTLRRYELYRGLIRFAAWISDEVCESPMSMLGDPGVDDDVLLALVYAASGGDDATRFANVTAGHALGSLNADEAGVFSGLVDRLVGGSMALAVSPEGEMTVVAA